MTLPTIMIQFHCKLNWVEDEELYKKYDVLLFISNPFNFIDLIFDVFPYFFLYKILWDFD